MKYLWFYKNWKIKLQHKEKIWQRILIYADRERILTYFAPKRLRKLFLILIVYLKFNVFGEMLILTTVFQEK